MKQSKNIPPRYAIRLEDLRPWHVIVATCAACRKRTHIDAKLLQHGRTPYSRLVHFERKLRCGSLRQLQRQHPDHLHGAEELGALGRY